MADSVSTKSSKKKLYIETSGCQMNILDSELVVSKLRRDCLLYTSPSPRD